jgi:hypothetical protein
MGISLYLTLHLYYDTASSNGGGKVRGEPRGRNGAVIADSNTYSDWGCERARTPYPLSTAPLSYSQWYFRAL